MSLPGLNSPEEFQKTIDSGDAVLVKFTAEWCGGCRTIAPMVEEVAKEVEDKVKVFEIDVDQNQTTPAQFGIMAIPALLFFKGGKEVARLGMARKEDVLSTIEGM